METQNKSHKPVFIAIVVLIVAIVIGIVIWRVGAQGLVKVFFWIFIILMILAILGLLFFAIWWLFFKTHKIDLVHVHKERLIKACKANRNPYPQFLWFWGGKEGLPARKVGVIEGICAIKSEAEMKPVTKGKKVLLQENTPSKSLFCIGFRSEGFFSSLFGSTEVVIVTKDEVTSLASQNVYLKGMSFTPPIYDIFFLSENFKDFWLIDRTIQSNIYRYTIQETYKELGNIVAESIDLSPKHQKIKEVQNLEMVRGGGTAPEQQR